MLLALRASLAVVTETIARADVVEVMEAEEVVAVETSEAVVEVVGEVVDVVVQADLLQALLRNKDDKNMARCFSMKDRHIAITSICPLIEIQTTKATNFLFQSDTYIPQLNPGKGPYFPACIFKSFKAYICLIDLYNFMYF